MDIYNQIKKDVGNFLMLFIIIALAYSCSSIGRDTTDGKRRSGVELRIDALTGCHYLEGTRGGLTPRLDANGNHICNN